MPVWSRDAAAIGTIASGVESAWYSDTPPISVVLPLPSGTSSQTSGMPLRISSTMSSWKRSGSQLSPVSRTSSRAHARKWSIVPSRSGPRRRLAATRGSLRAALGDLVELLELAAGVGLVLVAAAAGVGGRRLEQHPQLVHRGDVPA